MTSRGSSLQLRRTLALAVTLILFFAGTVRGGAAGRIPATRISDGASRIGDLKGGGPLMRIGLMTDVASISLFSPSGLALNGDRGRLSATSDKNSRREQNDLSFAARLRVAVGKPSVRIEVAQFDDPDRALDLAAELEEDYSEPVSLSYSETNSRYAVTIGEYKSESSASGMLERLRRAGHRSARIPASSASPSLQVTARDPESKLQWSSDLLAVRAAQPRRTPRMESRNIVSIRDSAGTANKPPDRVQNSPLEPAVVRVGERAYRGQIEVAVNRRGLLNVINVVPLEDYLRGVVPSEISPASFPEIETLKAQAIAARTYAVARTAAGGINRAEGFDLTDDARSQVYGGYSAEHPMTTRAVDETRGIVATYDGKPIEALYTSTCGGHTENSEAVFAGQPPQPYLRAVSCAAEKPALGKHQIRTARTTEPLIGTDGRSVAREFALLDALEFGLPRRLSPLYLKSAASRDELRRWADRAAALTGERRLAASRGDITRLAGFASLLASSVFGEAAMLLSPADVDYLLDGLGGDGMSREARADLALVIGAGVLRPSTDSKLNDSISVSRAQAIESFARALAFRFEIWSSENAGFISRILSARFNAASLGFRRAIAAPAEDGRLRLSAFLEAGQTSTSSGSARSRPGADKRDEGLEIASSAWLLRRLGGESYPLGRFVLIGGETVSFHTDSSGRVDFLEIESSSRGAASDRVSSASYWQVRLSANELEQKLARSRINVGGLHDLIPVAYGRSNRVVELEVQGSRGTARLRGSQVRSVLGLKESLFFISRERDRGPVTLVDITSRQNDRDRRPDVFVFTGRGWGHGVGLCQTGAYGLAREGYSYAAILKTYYSGVTLKKLY